MGAFFRNNSFLIILFLSFLWVQCMEHIYSKLYIQDLILENLHSFIYFYLIFLPECFVTIVTGIAQNPGLGLLLLGKVKI